MPCVGIGGWIKTNIPLKGAQRGDVVDVTFDQLGEAAVFLDARVSSAGTVTVFMRDEEDTDVDLGAGQLQVVVGRFVSV